MKNTKNTILATILLTALLPLFADAETEQTSATYRRRTAICVGINEYAGYPTLTYAVRDALEMSYILEDYGFDRVELLTGAEATREKIMETLQDVKKNAHEDDLFVFYFAGHGWTARRNDNSMMGYLIPSDCRKGREITQGMSMATVTRFANELPNRHSLLLVDACYSGYGMPTENALHNTPASRAMRQSSVRRDMDAMVNSRSVQVLTAGGHQDRAFESNGHGLFTRHVLDCLRHFSPEGQDGIVSGNELASHVTSSVVSETGGWQTPQFGRVGEGDIVLAMGPSRVPGSEVAMVTQP